MGKRSGLKVLGSGQDCGLRCRFHTLMKMSVPSGMVYSSNWSSSSALQQQQQQWWGQQWWRQQQEITHHDTDT